MKLLHRPVGARLRSALSSLKLRLAITGALLIALSVACTVFFVLRSLEQRSEHVILDSEVSDAQRQSNVLSSRLVSLQTSLRSAATRLPVDSLADSEAVLRFLQENVVLRGLFSSILIADRNGAVVAIADGQGMRIVTGSVADRSYFRRTIDEKRPIISEPVVSRFSGDTLIALTMPVTGRNGAVTAVLTGSLGLSSRGLMDDITRSGSGDDPVTTIITDSTGHIISHPDKRWLLRDALTEPRIAAAVAHWVEQGRPIEPQGQSSRIGDSVVATAGVPDADWVIYRTAPAEVLLGGPLAGRRQAVWIGTAVALAGGVIILLATLLLLRPLRLLEQRALRLLDDDLAADQGWPQASGELGALSSVFQQVMKQRLHSQQAGAVLFAKMSAVLDNAPVGIAFTRLGRFELVSAQFSRLLGYDQGSLISQPTEVICRSEEEYRALGVRTAAAFAVGRTFDEELELVRADGSHFWARRQGAPVLAGDTAAGTIWIITDITESRQQREQLSWTASHDALTGLVNRREFEARLAWQLRERRQKEPTCALVIDLDRFKAVNDSGGHAAGDEMLRQIANVMSARVRANDTVARLGGDEFAVLLTGCHVGEARRIAEQICERVQSLRLAWNGLSLQVGASIGLVEIDASFTDISAVMSAADSACYEAKRAGRNAVRSYPVGRLRVVETGSEAAPAPTGQTQPTSAATA